jgi:hypothetical protein
MVFRDTSNIGAVDRPNITIPSIAAIGSNSRDSAGGVMSPRWEMPESS